MREEDVHTAYGLAIVVLLHIEGLDLLRVVSHDDGRIVVLLDEITLMLAGEVGTPVDGELKFLAATNGFLEDGDTLGVGSAYEWTLHDEADALDELLVVMLGEELEIVHTVIQSPLEAVLGECLGEVLVTLIIHKGYLGLDHPELSEVARRIGILSSKGRTKGVDTA